MNVEEFKKKNSKKNILGFGLNKRPLNFNNSYNECNQFYKLLS
jgi:hypothetical protein